MLLHIRDILPRMHDAGLEPLVNTIWRMIHGMIHGRVVAAAVLDGRGTYVKVKSLGGVNMVKSNKL